MSIDAIVPSVGFVALIVLSPGADSTYLYCEVSGQSLTCC